MECCEGRVERLRVVFRGTGLQRLLPLRVEKDSVVLQMQYQLCSVVRPSMFQDSFFFALLHLKLLVPPLKSGRGILCPCHCRRTMLKP